MCIRDRYTINIYKRWRVGNAVVPIPQCMWRWRLSRGTGRWPPAHVFSLVFVCCVCGLRTRVWFDIENWHSSWYCKVRPFCMRECFFEVTDKDCFDFKLVFAPWGRKSSWVFSEWVWLLSERYPDQFPASRLSQLREFWTPSFFNFLARKRKVHQTEPPFWSSVSFMTAQLRNELVRNSRNCDSRETENWSGYLSESRQTHSEKSRLDFLTLRGKIYLKEKKNSVCSLKKKVPHNRLP